MAPGVGWTAELREAVREEREAALERAVERAVAENADALVLPGNLWDADTVPVAHLARVLEALASFAPRPVLVASGPLDSPARLPFGEASFRAALGIASWPANVHLFSSGAWERVSPPGREDVAFVGRAGDVSLPPEAPAPPASLSILVACAGGEPRVPEGWSWGAFGGRADALALREGERLRGGFAGAPVPASFAAEETGLLLVRLAAGEEPQVRRLPSSGVRFLDLTIPVDGIDQAGFVEEAARRMQEAGAGARDAVRLTIAGTPARGARFETPVLAGQVLHLALRDLTDRAPAAGSAASAESRFDADMRARLGSEEDATAAATARLALALGRAALAGRPLAPPRREELA